MYNTPQACWGTGEGYEISAYAFDIDTSKIVDRRRYSDWTLREHVLQAIVQGGRVLKSLSIGTEGVVEGIHDSFGNPLDVEAVLYNSSATLEREQRQAGLEQTSGIHPAFMVIRNPLITMHKIGEYRP
jgi:hypothetical protein